MSTTPVRPTAPGTAARAAGWVAPLCWIAVLLDGFDLVVVGTVVPTLREPEEYALTGTGASIPGNPFQALIEVATGTLVWPTVSTVLLVLGVLAVLALVFLAGYSRRQRRGPSASIDARAKLMASPSQLTGVTGKQARDKARRLRPELRTAALDLRPPSPRGVPGPPPGIGYGVTRRREAQHGPWGMG